jgi:oligoendopeptidase F
MAKALPKRSDIPKSHTWDLEALFASDAAWEAAFKEIDAAIPKSAQFKGKLGTAAGLLGFLKYVDTWSPKLRQVITFAALNADVDTTKQHYAEMLGRAMGLGSRYSEATAFFSPELLAIPDKKLSAMLRADAALGEYAHAIDNIKRTRAHVLSNDLESLLAAAQMPLSSPERAHGVLVDAELKFAPAVTSSGKKIALERGNFQQCQVSTDRKLRQSSFNSYYDAFLGMKNTLAEIMAGKVKATVFNARARRYPDSLTYAIYPNAIPNPVYHNVIDACNRNIGIWHRFWEAKRKLLKLKKIEGCDIFAPLSKPVRVTWEQACEWLVDGMAPLGPDYQRTVRAGVINDRWVDWRANVGKRGGAYSGGGWGTRPYILMSYHEEGLTGLSTLAHEVGHSMHTLLSCKHQSYVYSDYTLFAAEVASNFNQALVRAHLLETGRAKKDRNFQINIIEEAMYNFHRYLFVMPILSQWEHWMHQHVEQGGSLTADALNAKLAELFKRGYGPAWKLDAEREGVSWATYPHFYADFYVYQYASGIAAANALAAGVIADSSGKSAEAYLSFLRAGSSKYPIDALKLAGIDMSTAEPMDRAFKVLEGFVARLEALI